mmetsp:Transcript_15031/g.41076  ORF Transcript_15031/g.41076 Transcript_15031/m.41076 type:complete len:147 (-) Transcript_15031:36-476(-)
MRLLGKEEEKLLEAYALIMKERWEIADRVRKSTRSAGRQRLALLGLLFRSLRVFCNAVMTTLFALLICSTIAWIYLCETLPQYFYSLPSSIITLNILFLGDQELFKILMTHESANIVSWTLFSFMFCLQIPISVYIVFELPRTPTE